MNWIETEVAGVLIDQSPGATEGVPMVLLKALGEDFAMPIWIGVPEGLAIVAAIKKEEYSRPMTHDLLTSVIATLGGTVRRVDITGVVGETYLAEVEIARANGDSIVRIDSRPSDAIAVAVRVGCGIFVEGALFEGGKVAVTRATVGESTSESVISGTELLRDLKRKDFKYTM